MLTLHSRLARSQSTRKTVGNEVASVTAAKSSTLPPKATLARLVGVFRRFSIIYTHKIGNIVNIIISSFNLIGIHNYPMQSITIPY